MKIDALLKLDPFNINNEKKNKIIRDQNSVTYFASL